MAFSTIDDLSKPITSLDSADNQMNGDKSGLKPRDGSYVCGDTSVPLCRKTVLQVWSDTAAEFGHPEAAVFCEHDVRVDWLREIVSVYGPPTGPSGC